MKPQPPDPKYRMPNEALPEAVRELSQASNRPVIKRECLFFRESRPVFLVPDLQPWGTIHGSLRLDHRLYYLWQGDGSMAVYAYLFGGAVDSDKSYGCLSVGFVAPKDWTLGGKGP